MRSFVILLISFGVLMAAFMVYQLSQPLVEPLNKYPHSDVFKGIHPTTQGNRMGIGPGQGVWIERHDPNTARLVERFRGAHYDWNPDGTMKVEHPQAEFFLAQGRVLRISGQRGNVVVEQGMPSNGKSVVSSQPDAPTRGNMDDVTIRLLASIDATTPILTVTMNNATFDTQINRIYTSAATIDGKQLAPDQIPVHMRGADYDFDGRGLQIRWDQQHKTLQLLQIDHGERLVIKHPGRTRETSRQATDAPAPINGAASAAEDPVRHPKSPPRESIATTGTVAHASQSHASASQPALQAYRASFQKDVKVTQGGQEIAAANELQIDFASEENSTSTQATTTPAQPAAAMPGAHPLPGKNTNLNPATTPSDQQNRSTQPVIITWSGKLTVAPINQTGPLTADASGQVVHLMGSPAVVQQHATRIQAQSLEYGTTAQELIAAGDAQNPVIMTNRQGGRVQTQGLVYYRKPARARMSGAGQVSRPVKDRSGRLSEMRASWSQSCDLTFFGSDERSLQIHTADFTGNVKIDHPQIKLDADTLGMEFIEDTQTAEGAQQPDLQEMNARGAVSAVIVDSHGKTESMNCQSLHLSTALGARHQRYIDRMIADGQVIAQAPDQEIRAGHLDATLIPTANSTSENQPLAAVQLKHLLARQDVRVRGRDGATAEAAELDLAMAGAQAENITLKGSPARLTRGHNITSGDLIVLDPKDQRYTIPGPGSMHLSRQAENDSPPTDVSWQGALQADLNHNAIDIHRGVEIRTVASDQTTNTANSDQLHITLADRPATTTMSAHADPAPLFSGANQIDLPSQKQASALTMTGNVHLQSIRGDNTGKLLMQFDLESSRLDYDIPGQKMIVPEPGKIFFYDNRPASATSQPTNHDAPDNDRRGMTAIKWNGELIYDQSNACIALNDQVFLRHEPLDKNQSPIDLRADHMTINLLKTGQPSAAPEQMSIAHMQARDHVQFTSKAAQCQASSVEYTPASGVFIVSGSPRTPARLFDQDGASTGTFSSLDFNMKTQQIDRMTGFHAEVRR